MHVLAYAEQSDIIKTNNSLRNQQSQGLAPSGTQFNTHFTCFPHTKVQILTPEELLSAARTAAAAPVPYCNYVQQRACGPAAGAHTHTHTHVNAARTAAAAPVPYCNYVQQQARRPNPGQYLNRALMLP